MPQRVLLIVKCLDLQQTGIYYQLLSLQAGIDSFANFSCERYYALKCTQAPKSSMVVNVCYCGARMVLHCASYATRSIVVMKFDWAFGRIGTAVQALVNASALDQILYPTQPQVDNIIKPLT